MRGSKAGFGDLKHLHQQAQERAKAELAAAAAGKVEQAAAATRKVEQSAAAARGIAHKRTAPANGTEAEAQTDTPDAFRHAMKAVTPIKAAARVQHAPSPDSRPVPALRRASALGETPARADAGVSDGGEITHLLSEGGTAYVRGDAAPDTARKLRRGQWRAGAELDLHGLRVEQARHAMLSFLDECLSHGIRCVRVVHGKGYGSQGLEPVLKDKVRTWLVQKNDVVAFAEAPEREGGAGALLVLLRQTEGSAR